MNGGHCESCGVWVCTDPDIFGRESDEGRVVDGRLLCAECIERREGEE